MKDALVVRNAPWIKLARELVGVKEIVGSVHEPKVIKFFAEAGHPQVYDDETAWCAAFANAMLRRAGYGGTGSLAARSFLIWGEKLKEPIPGCLVIFKRGTSAWQGHVAFVLRDLGKSLEILGGNQGNAVTIIRYGKEDVLGYRWPTIKGTPTVVVAPKVKPAKDAGKAGGAVIVGGGVVAGANKIAIDYGWGFTEWAIFLFVLFGVGIGAYFLWRKWKAKRDNIEVVSPTVIPSWANTDANISGVEDAFVKTEEKK